MILTLAFVRSFNFNTLFRSLSFSQSDSQASLVIQANNSSSFFLFVRTVQIHKMFNHFIKSYDFIYTRDLSSARSYIVLFGFSFTPWDSQWFMFVHNNNTRTIFVQLSHARSFDLSSFGALVVHPCYLSLTRTYFRSLFCLFLSFFRSRFQKLLFRSAIGLI